MIAQRETHQREQVCNCGQRSWCFRSIVSKTCFVMVFYYQADLLSARAAELCHFDAKLRQRDDELNKMHFKVDKMSRQYHLLHCIL